MPNSLAWENNIVSARQKRGEDTGKTLCLGRTCLDYSGLHAEGCVKLITADRGQSSPRSPECFAEYLKVLRKKAVPRDPYLPSQRETERNENM